MQHLNYFQWLRLLMISVVLFFTACASDDDMTTEPPVEINEYDNAGFFVLNKGNNESEEDASISFYHRDFKVIKNNIYRDANNGASLGGTAHSMKIINDKAYIVLNSENKILIIDPLSMQKLGEINGLKFPRHIAQVSPEKAYVSQWGQNGSYGSIGIIDLNTNTLTDTIPTRQGPEEILRLGNNAYVANSGGLFVDSVLTKISIADDEVLKEIEVGLVPNYLEADKDLNLWVLSRGLILDPFDPSVNIRGKLQKVENDAVSLSLNVKTAASGFTINTSRDILYFVQNGWMYEHPITSTSISLVPYIERYFLSVDIDPFTGNIIGTDPKNNTQSGDVFIFNGEKVPLDTVEAGVVPGGISFLW